MSFTRQVYLEVDGEKDLSLVMAYHNGDGAPDWFEIEFFKSKDAIGKARWSVDVAHCAFLFDPASAPTAGGVTTCLETAISQGVIDRLWTSDGDSPKIRKAINDKAIAVLLDAAGGVAEIL